MCFTANSTEMNHAVYLSALEMDASRHFAGMELLRLIFTRGILLYYLLTKLLGLLLPLLNV